MKKIVLLLLAYATFVPLQAQQVSTIFNSATIQVDDGIVQDKHGNIYGSHYMGSNVYKITPSGVSTVFKSGLNTPNGLAFDSQGNLYAAGIAYGTGYPVTTGAYQTTFGGGSATYLDFWGDPVPNSGTFNDLVHNGFDISISKFSPIIFCLSFKVPPVIIIVLSDNSIP